MNELERKRLTDIFKEESDDEEFLGFPAQFFCLPAGIS